MQVDGMNVDVPSETANEASGMTDIEMMEGFADGTLIEPESAIATESEQPFAAPTAPMMQAKKPAPTPPTLAIPDAVPAVADPQSANKSFDDLFETPTTSSFKVLDLDSMFADMEGDASGKNEGNATDFDGPNTADMDFSLNDDVSKLLSGVDAFANGGSDLNLNATGDLDLDMGLNPPDPSTESGAATNPAAPAPDNSAHLPDITDLTQPQSATEFPGDSLDDLFNLDPFQDDNSQAPENNQFNDAFFPFGDD
jgi:hypothetical protein